MKTGQTFTLRIAHVSDSLFDGEAVSVTIPGVEGELTLLAKHEPIITLMKKGKVTVRKEEGEEVFEVEGGVVEASSNQVTILL